MDIILFCETVKHPTSPFDSFFSDSLHVGFYQSEEKYAATAAQFYPDHIYFYARIEPWVSYDNDST